MRVNPDQWNYYIYYVEAVFEVASQNATVIDRAKVFISSLLQQERSKSSNRLRGPYLAMLYFWQQLQEHKFDASVMFGKFLLMT